MVLTGEPPDPTRIPGRVPLPRPLPGARLRQGRRGGGGRAVPYGAVDILPAVPEAQAACYYAEKTAH
ncbi:hypothetical protein GCM10020220_051710 [Nonomuraea rubra]